MATENGSGASDAWDRLRAIPDLGDAPIDGAWAAPVGHDRAAPDDRAERDAVVSDPPGEPGESRPAVDTRRIRVRPGPGEASRSDVEGTPAVPGGDPAPPIGPATDAPLPSPADDDAGGRRIATATTVRRVLALLVALVVLLGLGSGIYAWLQWRDIERVDTAGRLSSADDGFTNYLIVGVDSREGVDPTLATAGSIGLGVPGSRSDTMVLLHVGADAKIMSLPRDLWVDIDGGGTGKLNAATVIGGAPALIGTVRDALGVPVHRYLEVDIAGFLDVAASLGSITIDFPRPACDPKSGLMIRRRGPIELGPQQALAYVRSRTYTEFDASAAKGLSCDEIRSRGLGTTIGNADFGRTERQRRFLLATFDRIGSTKNPVTLLRVLGGVSDGMRVDDGMSMLDAVGLARKLRGFDPVDVQLPVSDFPAPDGSAALQLTGDAEGVLDGFRAADQ